MKYLYLRKTTVCNNVIFVIQYSLFVTKFSYHSLLPCFDWIVVRFVLRFYITCMEWRSLPFITIYISVPIIECVKFTFSSLLFELLQNSILFGGIHFNDVYSCSKDVFKNFIILFYIYTLYFRLDNIYW